MPLNELFAKRIYRVFSRSPTSFLTMRFLIFLRYLRRFKHRFEHARSEWQWWRFEVMVQSDIVWRFSSSLVKNKQTYDLIACSMLFETLDVSAHDCWRQTNRILIRRNTVEILLRKEIFQSCLEKEKIDVNGINHVAKIEAWNEPWDSFDDFLIQRFLHWTNANREQKHFLPLVVHHEHQEEESLLINREK